MYKLIYKKLLLELKIFMYRLFKTDHERLPCKVQKLEGHP